MSTFQKTPGDGTGAREVESKPAPTPETPTAAEGTPPAPNYIGHTRTYEDSTSMKSRLAPFACEISAGLEENFTLSRLNDAVLMGQLTSSEANAIAKSLNLRGEK